MRGAKSFLEEIRRLSGAPACAAVIRGRGATDCVNAGLTLANVPWSGKNIAPLNRLAVHRAAVVRIEVGQVVILVKESPDGTPSAGHSSK